MYVKPPLGQVNTGKRIGWTPFQPNHGPTHIIKKKACWAIYRPKKSGWVGPELSPDLKVCLARLIFPQEIRPCLGP
jgi:hypothetical protein